MDSRPTADVCDEFESVVQTCSGRFRLYGGRPRFCGQIETVRCLEDNVLVRTALSQPGGGRVLVIDGGASLRVALVGDVIAGLAAANRWAGVVVNGAVRDVDALRTVDIGLAALGSNPRRSAKRGAGETGGTVQFGGAVFAPGDTVYVDRDGIAVVPAGHG